ncbi:MAG: carotenoid biosynthesis protein, partial [Proteobacteria bacterium]|nr:carotenoid biosynthesis protein [Pseudomonadota bacterium]
LTHAALANFPDDGFASLGIPRMHFVPTIVFPMVWVVAYFILRIRNSKRLKNRSMAYAALAVMTLCVPLLVVFAHVPYELSHEQLTLVFEVSQFFWVGLLMVQVTMTRGGYGLLMFFGVTLVYGIVLENTGIVMNFFYEPSFRLYIFSLPAPLCTVLGWSVVFYIMVSVTESFSKWYPWLKQGIWRRAFVATAMALCLDAQLDPLASMSGVFWRWNELLPPAFLGVPLINFAAWFGAFLPFTYFTFYILDREDWGPRRQNWELFLRISWSALLGGLLCFAVMAIAEGGFGGPTFKILAAFQDRLMPY